MARPVLTLNYSHGLLYSLMVRQLYDDGFIDLAKVVANSTTTTIERDFAPKQLAVLVQQALNEGKAISDGAKLFGLTKEEDDLSMEGGHLDSDIKESVTGSKTGASSLSVSVTGSASLYDTKDHKSTAAAATAAPSATAGSSSSSSAAAAAAATAAAATAAAAAAASAAAASAAAAAIAARKSKVFPAYQTKFTTSHKNAVTCARFSPDGTYAVTGSADCALKILEVAKMHYNAQAVKTEKAEDAATRPIYRAYYDHQDVINDVDFHPIEPFVASCSKDCTIKFFDHSKTNAKRCQKQINESHNVRSIAFHPSGDYLLAGTEHQMIRLYDVSTFQAYLSSDTSAHHFGSINQVRWNATGSMYVSCAKDGHIKLWDGINNKCVVTIRNAHGGSEVSSVSFSSSGKYVLSGGKDSMVRLWDVSTGKQVMYYAGAHQQKYRMQSAFDYSHDFVLSPDENNCNIVVWDVRTGELLKKVPGHNKLVRWIAASPTEPSFMSCSEDQRARFWSSID